MRLQAQLLRLASFLLSGMPMLAVLPFMMIELCAYGLVAGLLREIKLPSLVRWLSPNLPAVSY